MTPKAPAPLADAAMGTRNLLEQKGPQAVADWMRAQKKVLITETGWPSRGENLKGAFPSEKSALEYFINTQMWALDENVEVFYFSSFDESWKVGAEGEVGAYWGIWDKNEQLKFQNR